MTHITRISRLKHPGVVRDFAWPAELPTLGRYNLIYGWNGSGKTTVSELFRALEHRRAPAFGEATLTIDGQEIAGAQFDQAHLPVRVFNRTFVQESVFPSQGGDVPPIFIVGKENVEKQKEADRLKVALETARGQLAENRNAFQRAERALDGHCISSANAIKAALRSSGANPYNNYNKANYRTCVDSISGGTKPREDIDDTTQDQLEAQARAELKPKIDYVPLSLPDLGALSQTVARLCQTTVVSSAIESLKSDEQLASWVRSGLHIHQSRDTDKCLFCERDLPQDRIAALEAHFNAQYEKFIEEIDSQLQDLSKTKAALSSDTLPRPGDFYPDLASSVDQTRTEIQAALSNAQTTIDKLLDALRAKKGKPFEPLAIEQVVEGIDDKAVTRLTELIAQHDHACDEFQERVRRTREKLEAGAVSAKVDEFINLKQAVESAELAVKTDEAEAKRLEDDILRLEREIVEHREPAEELNADLASYLGHKELRLEVKDTGYSISRHGVVAEALSEGEMTAIALLYFLKSLRDRRFDIGKGLVVLDDPVSSLDANALYLAFGFIRERTQGAGQLVVLTHNFNFFRQVRNWFHHLPDQRKKDVSKRPARFYMLDCRLADGERRSTIRALDPLLERYDSEYHYLFSRVYRCANAANENTLEENYVVPNVARRLLEAFLAFRQPHISGELWQKLKAINFDEAKKIRILRFVHTHSHADAVEDPEHNISTLNEASAALKELLELFQSEDLQHYTSMVKLIEPEPDEEDEAA